MKFINPNFNAAIVTEDTIVVLNTKTGESSVRPLPVSIEKVNASVFYNDSIVLATKKGIVIIDEFGATVKEHQTNWTSINIVKGVCVLVGVTRTANIAFATLDCDKFSKFSSRTIGYATAIPSILHDKNGTIFIIDGKRIINMETKDVCDIDIYDSKCVGDDTIIIGTTVGDTLGNIGATNILQAVKSTKPPYNKTKIIDSEHFRDDRGIYKVVTDSEGVISSEKLWGVTWNQQVERIDDTFVCYTKCSVTLHNVGEADIQFKLEDAIKTVVNYQVSNVVSKNLSGHKVDQVIELVVGGDVTIDPTIESPLRDFVDCYGTTHIVDLVEAAGLMYTLNGQIVPIIFDNSDNTIAGIYDCEFKDGVFVLNERVGSINPEFVLDDNNLHAMDWELSNIIVDIIWF